MDDLIGFLFVPSLFSGIKLKKSDVKILVYTTMVPVFIRKGILHEYYLVN